MTGGVQDSDAGAADAALARHVPAAGGAALDHRLISHILHPGP